MLKGDELGGVGGFGVAAGICWREGNPKGNCFFNPVFPDFTRQGAEVRNLLSLNFLERNRFLLASGALLLAANIYHQGPSQQETRQKGVKAKSFHGDLGGIETVI